jgi:FkbM family methyltransferase
MSNEPTMIKSIIRAMFHPVAVRMGYVFPARSGPPVKPAPQPVSPTLVDKFYDVLAKSGFEPVHIMDVGANHGHYTRKARSKFPKARITMIEPQGWLQPSFQDLLDNDPLIQFFPVGAGRRRGSFQFTIAKRDDSSTFRLSPEEAKARGLEQKEIPVVTLNELVTENGLPVPDLVKIDAEGLDLEVLEGASDFFGRTEVFMVEAGVVNKMFANSVLDMVKYMDDKGYRLVDITDLNRPFDVPVLWLVELAFVRKGGVVDSRTWL